MQPPVPENEAERVSALHDLAVLDTPPETDFDDIVRIASEVCGAPISLVTLVDTQRQWFKAKIGPVGPAETPREVAFCAHAIMGRDLMVVPDATADARFADNPFVNAEDGIRFYAGAPLLTSEGAALGTLCVVDHAPHRLNLDQMRALRALAKQVTELLELRRLVAATALDGQLEARSVDLTYLTEARIRELRPIADARNIAITLGVADAASVQADPGKLSRALDYVIFSALKVAPAGGRVAVRVLATPVPAVELSHAGGSIAPEWEADLRGVRVADELVPRAVADILRAHGATVVRTSQTFGSPDVRFELRFQPH
ncbi:GAF domain-containing sensor histidine kinase [Dactylosporangium aurantiacum]|uniref:GAF domain-containing sensor histidine kinase n=1 Tax=Dactylosporangium aurantiacum TaxID=35754 RepID=A0A9Q9IC22_9ACTN|nr:GAF domain-containing protein [Dactylosporangium aurantiacum]MDG6102430.1 GAF domain-containing protein [Dactylosporangium aurantiacum]UWZ53282.1 GAF domain-containing sensor histidine kinase [Dactylosporangium aurantiacum]